MLDQQGSSLRSVAWSELLPWLVIFRCLGLALRPSMLLLAAAGAWLTVVGWALFAWAVPELAGTPVSNSWQTLTSVVPDQPTVPLLGTSLPWDTKPLAAREAEPVGGIVGPVYGTWEQLSRPWRAIFANNQLSWSGLLSLVLCGLWATVVWAFFGAAITRMAAVELAAEERIGLLAVLRFAKTKWLSFLAAPLVSLGIVFAIATAMAVASWVLQWWALAILWGLLWGLFLVGGTLMAVLLVGLLFGWPLMWPTIATEGTDGFDAWNRSHSYLAERPLHYLFYMLVAMLLGILGWLLVANVTAAGIQLTYWAAHWTVDPNWLQDMARGTGELGVATPGSWLMRAWVGVLKLLAVGFLFSYFWSSATAVYLLMRQKVDAAEMDEIALEEDHEEPYGLPPLKTDAVGVPLVDDDEE